MSNASRKWTWIVTSLVGGAIVASLVAFSLTREKNGESTPPNEFPLPPYSQNSFLNTGSDARYLGSEACAVCHPANHQSYLHTAHSRALSDVNLAIEPPDGTFEHKPSGRIYRVYRRDNQMRHEEIVRHEGDVIARVDFPMRYLVGSGHFSRSYIVEVDGFLHESPITWYAGKQKWGMSPGYDGARHAGFDRPIIETCLYCHAGRVEPVDGAAHRLTLHEKAIGCESCHGPGSVHREFHLAKKSIVGDVDLTIVNPRKLSRSLQEDICATCHLTGASPILLRGRSINDYRPGTPLSDYRIHYRVDDGRDEMAVVGHVEQMRQSACYQKSEMTCLTCHDPHEREKPKDIAAAFRKVCMNCHEKQPCSLDLTQRLKKYGTDNCTACHMPRGDTDIPHIAFTHHRIGHHGRKLEMSQRRAPELVPIERNLHLSEADRQRNLGLAYLEAAGNASYAEQYGAQFQEKGLKLLQNLYAAGLRDPESMRHLMNGEDASRLRGPSQYALEIVSVKVAPANARASALMSLARTEFQNGDYAAAGDRLVEHNKIFNTPDSLRLLGFCYLQQNRAEESLLPLRKSLTLRPFRPATHESLDTAYQLLGNKAKSAEHSRKSQLLTRLGQD